jgi:flagellar biosynthetic protein FlhB
MAEDQGQKSEQPTKRRVEKAREQGQFPVSREFVSAVQFLGFAWLLAARGGDLFGKTGDFARVVLRQAFHVPLDLVGLMRLYREALFAVLVPLLLAGAVLTAVMTTAQLATTQLGISFQKLVPDWQRLSPARKLQDLPKQGMAALGQALLLLPAFGYVVYLIASDNFRAYLSLSRFSLGPAMQLVVASYRSLLWKAGFVLFLIGAVDFLRQRSRHAESLRMTKQEVKEENKQSEGNPQIKQRIRRIQRDLARRNMMKEVSKATAVIVNPTHYAVAIRYEMEEMAAPRVVAKGKNYLAQRIRQIAMDHQVPIVENQPLAQALYKAADVGQEIPPHLYRAVAEILAYLFKLMNQQGRR